MNDPSRKIIHVDMDAFYASVEQRDHPELRGRPVAVGGTPEGRGVVAAASYEARRHGVRSAMSSAKARRACPELVFVRPRFAVYRAESARIRAIFRDYTDRIEPLSLDEAYLDVSDSPLHHGSATRIAQEIRDRIRHETGLTASAGVAGNKFLAKLASDVDKPDGLFVIEPAAGPEFVAALDVARFHGIGPATAARMRALGIETGADLRQWSEAELRARFGRVGSRYYWLARAVDERPVTTGGRRKSIGQETTFAEDLYASEEMLAVLERLAEPVIRRLGELDLRARTLTIKVRFGDFTTCTRSRTDDPGFTELAAVEAVLPELLQRAGAPGRPVRLLGVTVSNLHPRGPSQAGLWEG